MIVSSLCKDAEAKLLRYLPPLPYSILLDTRLIKTPINSRANQDIIFQIFMFDTHTDIRIIHKTFLSILRYYQERKL